MRKKIALLGDSAVGKTSLIRRFVFDQFEDSHIATIGSKVTMKRLVLPRPDRTVNLKLMIWDLIGREGYRALHARTFAGVHGAILVADLTRQETLESLERYWIPSLMKVVESVPLVFVCNKSDLKKEFEFGPDDLTETASRYNVGLDGVLPSGLETVYSTSAKNGSNVETMFESMGHLVLAERTPSDPVKALYESLVATGVQRTTDKTTPVGALDAIMVDFCAGYDDSRTAMLILRQEIARAGVDINDPTREGIFRTVEYLAEAESEFKDEEDLLANLERRLGWAHRVKE
ncbi:MAG: GTP-binding protein [Candidatus Thermoplasmatota archaeon]|nr:GTP-binding protein [Candidatus Thermoplasmatota archaeon]